MSGQALFVIVFLIFVIALYIMSIKKLNKLSKVNKNLFSFVVLYGFNTIGSNFNLVIPINFVLTSYFLYFLLDKQIKGV